MRFKIFVLFEYFILKIFQSVYISVEEEKGVLKKNLFKILKLLKIQNSKMT